MMFGINKKILDEIVYILSTDENIVNAYIFGSRARGDFKDYSDIDIALFVEDGNRSSTIAVDINEINCIYKFDIVMIKESTTKELLDNIRRDGVKIYQRS
ncbi:Nucleotidyltransferase domain-containing protein [Anaerovirgula multivorans]|uniref:Nucleotidyltransferase domain-containing protein n=1 Tax=Anaerovirgula multivorans TaxID=312168 RepID=A0A239G042_9FIRM|nr:nucleotidyltransferase domain-containing protein [Anaerovirgula multivorans]SNS62657.1 Nucleotidyltransferase domain-containing protein [Anaerovirgula multivorans]